MRKDTRFSRSSREDLRSKLNPGTLSDAQALGVWDMMLRADDPSEVSHLYRSYRDSGRCTLPKETLRHMRDVMVSDMREQNRKDPNPRVQTQRGRNTAAYNDGWQDHRRGA
jgi:hypothetical protein